ncbi:MAG: phenylalanine--tRNA ligase subunit beta [Bryobacteraceae bacterium]
MKFSYNWICELVDGLDLAPKNLERLITMKTAECEGIEPVGELLAGACTAAVVSAVPITGSRNRLAVVDTARYGRKTVVCGAANCRAGITTVYVPLEAKTIQGIVSEGMLASGAELGINRDAGGVVEIEPGIDWSLKPDFIIDIDNKSITHRPDLWGHHGMAREVAAISGRSLRDPAALSLLPPGPGAIGVEIEDFALCARYSALVFDNVTVGPSPPWLQYRLESIGLNSINNIVDFTNLVMAELGQPAHAFDRALLTGDTIYIRPARAGERIVALNDEEYALEPANLVIADGAGPVAIAGVIGGKGSAIGDSTTSIVLESACFHASSIRKTSSQLKLRTDASMRFEKSQDPANTVRALARAMELLPLLSPGIRLVAGVADCGGAAASLPLIHLPLGWLVKKLGREVSVEQVRGILESLQFRTSDSGYGVLEVEVPSWRATKDVAIKEDLVEEVGRMIGYDSIEPRPPAVLTTVPPSSPELEFHRAIRRKISAQGFTEVSNYSFVSEEQGVVFGFDPAAHLRVANPIASGQTLMRTSLLPGIRKNILDNARHFDTFRLFEMGREIHPRAQGLPAEIPSLAAAIYSRGDGTAELLEAKRVALCLMPGATVQPVAARPYEHPVRAAEVSWRGSVVGRLFELHPAVVEEGRAAILYLNLQTVLGLAPHETRYLPPRRFPSSAFDLSVIAEKRELVGDVKTKLAAQAPSGLLERIEYVRQYAGPPFPDDRKSVSFRLTVGSAEKTLSAEEVGAIRTAVIEGMRALGYDLRI